MEYIFFYFMFPDKRHHFKKNKKHFSFTYIYMWLTPSTTRLFIDSSFS